MKAVSKFSLWFLAALLLASAAPVRAQVAVYDFYTSCIVLEVFQLTDGNDNVINPNDFVTPLSHYQGFPATDYDNGVKFDLALPFTFIYNGVPYNSVNVAVNGWINFGKVPLDTRDPQLLFNANLPNATIAPFFGDHYLRPDSTQGFTPSRISWAVDGDPSAGDAVFTIQWEDLNINYLSAADPKQSIATFQVKLFQQSTNQLQTGRGNIEFQYGNIGSGLVQTAGASVGIEDENGLSFMNGLFTTCSDPLDSVRHSYRRTLNWPPSRQPGRAIQYVPYGFIVNDWGDGDANLSQVPPPPAGTPIVTPADVLTILYSRAWNMPLDSVFGRSAFHGDVNHNGRYTIDINGVKHKDTTRTMDYQFGHPNEVVYFEADAFDAAYILLYLAAKLPNLPWILDTLPPFGKLPGAIATSVSFGTTATEQNDHFVVVPINMQGVGAMSAEFSLAYDKSALSLVSVSQNPACDLMMATHGDRIVIAGAGEHATPQTVAYARFEKINGIVNPTIGTAGLTVNDRLAKDISVTVGAPVSQDLGAYPDPFYSQDGGTQIHYTTTTDGLVTLKIYDVLGNVVRTLVSSEQSHGSYSVVFDGRDGFNKELPSGTYFYRLDADGVSKTKQLVVYNGVK